jgi:hypothetical protein
MDDILRDAAALDAVDRKLLLVDDRVTAVVRGLSTGLYLFGGGGLGKSYSVQKKLELLEADFRTFNSRMTALGLFNALDKHPSVIHVLEDMERITKDRDAQALLRAALWSQRDQDRVITWTTGDGERRITFKGGLIMTANRPLSDLPELRALASRIAVHRLEFSDLEMAAHMRRIASSNWSRYQFKLEREKCRIVAEHVISECRRANIQPDLRLFDNGCFDFLQWERGDSHLDWRDLVSTRVRQNAAHFRHEISMMSCEQKKERERGLVRDITRQTVDANERVRLWEQETGKSKSTFYSRLREVNSGEFDA